MPRWPTFVKIAYEKSNLNKIVNKTVRRDLLSTSWIQFKKKFKKDEPTNDNAVPIINFVVSEYKKGLTAAEIKQLNILTLPAAKDKPKTKKSKKEYYDEKTGKYKRRKTRSSKDKLERKIIDELELVRKFGPDSNIAKTYAKNYTDFSRKLDVIKDNVEHRIKKVKEEDTFGEITNAKLDKMTKDFIISETQKFQQDPSYELIKSGVKDLVFTAEKHILSQPGYITPPTLSQSLGRVPTSSIITMPSAQFSEVYTPYQYPRGTIPPVFQQQHDPRTQITFEQRESVSPKVRKRSIEENLELSVQNRNEVIDEIHQARKYFSLKEKENPNWIHSPEAKNVIDREQQKIDVAKLLDDEINELIEQAKQIEEFGISEEEEIEEERKYEEEEEVYEHNIPSPDITLPTEEIKTEEIEEPKMEPEILSEYNDPRKMNDYQNMTTSILDYLQKTNKLNSYQQIVNYIKSKGESEETYEDLLLKVINLNPEYGVLNQLFSKYMYEYLTPEDFKNKLPEDLKGNDKINEIELSLIDPKKYKKIHELSGAIYGDDYEFDRMQDFLEDIMRNRPDEKDFMKALEGGSIFKRKLYGGNLFGYPTSYIINERIMPGYFESIIESRSGNKDVWGRTVRL